MFERPYLEYIRQVVERLPSKCEALNSNPSTIPPKDPGIYGKSTIYSKKQMDSLKSGLPQKSHTYHGHLENICMNGVATTDTREMEILRRLKIYPDVTAGG
jgi:hypothetical protein